MADEKQRESTERTTQETEPDVSYAYANNTVFEGSIWDLKILFGELTASQLGPKGVDWHTVITMPWAVAKLMSYYIQVNLAVYEHQHGKIKIPQGMIPQPLSNPLDNESSNLLFARLEELRAEFLRNL